jgi:hypothetical protein
MIGNAWRKTASANEIEAMAKIRGQRLKSFLMIFFSFAYL